MATKTEISNMALGLVGASRIEDFLTDQSTIAKLCRDYMESSIDMVLEAFNWDFAGKRKILAELQPDEPAFGYDSAFTLPADYLKMREVDQLRENEWRIEGRTIYTNDSDIAIIYTFRVVDTGQFTPGFVFALVRLLASQLAYPITKNNRRSRELLEEFQAFLAMAENLNSYTGHDQYAPEDFIEVRISH